MPQSIHDRIEQVQLSLRKNQKEFAEEFLHTSKQTYSAMLKSRSSFNITIIQSLAYAAPNLNLRWLITGEGQMNTARLRERVADDTKIEEPAAEYQKQAIDYQRELQHCQEKNQLLEELLNVYRQKTTSK